MSKGNVFHVINQMVSFKMKVKINVINAIRAAKLVMEFKAINVMNAMNKIKFIIQIRLVNSAI